MIGRRFRFHGYGSLRYVYRNGQTARGPWFAIKSTPNDKRKEPRFGVVVSRKVNKSAVVRNRIRRRLYEILREFSPNINGSPDVVVTVFHDSVAEEPHKNLTTQLKKQLRELGLL